MFPHVWQLSKVNSYFQFIVIIIVVFVAVQSFRIVLFFPVQPFICYRAKCSFSSNLTDQKDVGSKSNGDIKGINYTVGLIRGGLH